MAEGEQFSIKKGGQDYSFLLLRHLDRMSESQKIGLDIGVVNTKQLIGYRNQISHMENILTPILDQEYKDKRDEFIRKIPRISNTWSSDLNLQIAYQEAISKILKLQIQKAYNKRIIKLPYKFEDMKSLDDLEELF